MAVKQDGFVSGWCWMSHPDWNEGRPVPTLLESRGGNHYYIPLDPMDATEFEWKLRSSEWEMIRDPLAEVKAVTLNEELLHVCQQAADWLNISDPPPAWEAMRTKLLAVLARVTGEQS